MPSGASCVVSAHLDDAVFSAWHVLAGSPQSYVITVFAGVPEPGFVTALDRLRGGAESAAMMRRRRSDDRAALAHARAEARQLNRLDVDYRAFRRPALRAAIEQDPDHFIPLVAADEAVREDPEELVEVLAEAVAGLASPTVYVPVSIGGHPDHRDVASAGMLLHARGYDVRLYADIPYLFRHGLPSWLGGAANEPADAAVADAFAAVGCDPAALLREVVELDPELLADKDRAMRCYRTEFALVNEDFGGALDDASLMRSEVFWRWPGDALREHGDG